MTTYGSLVYVGILESSCFLISAKSFAVLLSIIFSAIFSCPTLFIILLLVFSDGGTVTPVTIIFTSKTIKDAQSNVLDCFIVNFVFLLRFALNKFIPPKLVLKQIHYKL